VLLGRRRHRLVRARRRRVGAGRDAGLAASNGGGPSGRPRDDDTFVSQPERSSKPAGLFNDDYDPTPHHDDGTTTFATGPSHCDHGATSTSTSTSTPAAAQSADTDTDTDAYTSSSVSHRPSAHGHPLNTDGAS
jgi:hypothetical protein